MRAVVVYESMYGNTHLIADAIGAGPAALTGRAAKGVNRLLREHGFDVVAEPESFPATSFTSRGPALSRSELGPAARAEGSSTRPGRHTEASCRAESRPRVPAAQVRDRHRGK